MLRRKKLRKIASSNCIQLYLCCYQLLCYLTHAILRYCEGWTTSELVRRRDCNISTYKIVVVVYLSLKC